MFARQRRDLPLHGRRLLIARIPRAAKAERRRATASAGVSSHGFAVARRDPLVRLTLVTLFIFALLCVPFSSQIPVVAAENLGMDVETLAYGLLFASFGFGGVVGRDRRRHVPERRVEDAMIRRSLLGFAVALLVFALLRPPSPAYPVVGAARLHLLRHGTAMNTMLQNHLDESVRGRVMALWIMCFGGIVPARLV